MSWAGFVDRRPIGLVVAVGLLMADVGCAPPTDDTQIGSVVRPAALRGDAEPDEPQLKIDHDVVPYPDRHNPFEPAEADRRVVQSDGPGPVVSVPVDETLPRLVGIGGLAERDGVGPPGTSATRALLTRGGQIRVLAVGQDWNGLIVEAVGDDSVTVTHLGVRRVLRLPPAGRPMKSPKTDEPGEFDDPDDFNGPGEFDDLDGSDVSDGLGVSQS